MKINESDMKEFVNKLPDLDKQPPTVHLLMLAARSKKAKELLGFKIRDLVIERDVIRPMNIWRKRYFSKLYNLTVLQQYGLYDIKSETVNLTKSIPPQAMGIYATLSPRNVYFALSALMKENIDYLYMKDDHADQELAKQFSRFFGLLHQHKARGTNYITFDIDTLEPQVFHSVRDVLSSFPKFMITETSGGYHIVVDLNKSSDAADFYKNDTIGKATYYAEKYLAQIDIMKDPQEPVPGTLYCRKGGEEYYVRYVE